MSRRKNGWFRVLTGKNVIGIESQCTWIVMDTDPKVANYGASETGSGHIFPSNPLGIVDLVAQAGGHGEIASGHEQKTPEDEIAAQLWS